MLFHSVFLIICFSLLQHKSWTINTEITENWLWVVYIALLNVRGKGHLENTYISNSFTCVLLTKTLSGLKHWNHLCNLPCVGRQRAAAAGRAVWTYVIKIFPFWLSFLCIFVRGGNCASGMILVTTPSLLLIYIK